jgi:hypothetical protein
MSLSSTPVHQSWRTIPCQLCTTAYVICIYRYLPYLLFHLELKDTSRRQIEISYIETTAKLSLFLTKNYAMKTYGVKDVYIHVFLTLTLVSGEWSALIKDLPET